MDVYKIKQLKDEFASHFIVHLVNTIKKMKAALLLVAVLAAIGLSAGQWNPNYASGPNGPRTTMVHLFEWKFVIIFMQFYNQQHYVIIILFLRPTLPKNAKPSSVPAASVASR